MTTQYTPKLKLALPVQGELSGTWGDVVNENITSMLEEAIAGRSVIDSWTTNAHVLTEADGTTAESRSAMLEFTDTGVALTGAATVTCPAISKIYICKNDSGQQVTITTAAGTGVDIPDGATMLVFCDGTNVVQGTTNVNSLTYQGYTVTFGGNFTTANSFTTAGDFALTLTATGATNVTLPTTGTLATLDGEETFTNKTFTSPTITSPTMTGSISAADLDISGDTTIGDAAADTLTITATVTSNITFTDDTYDIGADGATRPRSLYLSQDLVVGDAAAITGNATVGGTLGVTGNVAVNTDKVTIEATTGNTAIAGTLGVTGNITASAALVTDTISEKTATSGVTIDGVVLKDGGATVTADINFGDNDKAIFGAGSDLQIYHDGGHSYIRDIGTGNLRILGTDVDIRNSGNTASLIKAIDGGSAYLYENGTIRLATTSTGIDVTGTATMDGLTVDSAFPQVFLSENDRTNNNTLIQHNANNLSIGGVDDDGSSNFKTRLVVEQDTGDISFYEQTGTTPKFFWDASAESLGIGTSSPSAALDVIGNIESSGSATIGGGVYTSNGSAGFPVHTFSGDNDTGMYQAGANQLGFTTGGSERMRIDSSGNVGIGTSSIDEKLTIGSGGSIGIQRNSGVSPSIAFASDNTTDFSIEARYADLNGVAKQKIAFVNESTSARKGIAFYTTNLTDASDAGIERMRIDSSGNVGIGTSSPNYTLDLQSDDCRIALTDKGGTAGDYGELRYYNGRFIISADDSDVNSDSTIEFQIDDNEAMRIDSSGNVGIGTSSPSAKLDVGSSSDPNVSMDASASGNLRVSGGGYTFAIANNDTGTYLYNNGSSRAMVFGVNETERMRIDSSGNLLVGTTSSSIVSSSGTRGFNYIDGNYLAVASPSVSAYFNRQDSDGDIIVLRKAGSTVGSIGVNATRPYLANNTFGVKLVNNDFRTCSTTGADVDATYDLGDPDARWRDLYLSGGVYLGGTGSANYLDDYEEGTWTPAFSAIGGGAATSGTITTNGTYTKVGEVVNARFNIIFGTSMTWTALNSYFQLTGLPFAAANDFSSFAVATGNIASTGASGTGRTIATTSSAYLWGFTKSGGTVTQISGSIVYETNS